MTLCHLCQGECCSLKGFVLAQMRCIQTWGLRDWGSLAQNPWKEQGCAKAAEQNTEPGQSLGLGLTTHVICIMKVGVFFMFLWFG